MVKIRQDVSKLPLYVQIKELLRREISARRWSPGDRLPPETQLAQDLGVAVGTLRKALSSLEADGILARKQGSGTYVERMSDGEAIYHFFHLELHSDVTGIPYATVLSLNLTDDLNLKKHFTLSADQKFWQIRRLRFLNQTPVALEDIYLPHARVENLSISDLHESLYFFYREKLQFWVSRVEDSITVDYLPEWGNGKLDIESFKACGLIKRVAYDQFNRPCEYLLSWFNPDVAKYSARWN